MSEHPELALLQTAPEKSSSPSTPSPAPLFSLHDTARNFAAAIYLWLHREVSSLLPSLPLLLLLP